MIALAFHFPAGRYHATPWGRHVNEADVAWPPEPWRLLRALVAVWHRKGDRERFPESTLARLVEALAAQLPSYRLPASSESHTRHYMPVPEGRREGRTLVFDGFAHLSGDKPLLVAWPELELDDDLLALLDHLLPLFGYLGRAESWVTAERLRDLHSEDLDCRPLGGGAEPSDAATVSLLAPLPPAEYARWREAWVARSGSAGRRKGRDRAFLPESFLDLLRLETSDLHAARWSRPPGTRWVSYARPSRRRVWRQGRSARPAAKLTTARFALVGKPLPRVEDTVRIGEALRKALIAKAQSVSPQGPVPAVLSGHGAKGVTSHRHAFFLPEDADDDGHVDHLVVHADDGLADALGALGGLERLWVERGSDWHVLLEGVTAADAVAGVSRLLRSSAVWESVTPYLHPWFRRKRLGVEQQIARELSLRDPAPSIKRLAQLPTIRVHGRERRPVHFHRFRSKHGLAQPDRQGSFWRLELAEPIVGPLALGFGCHFGLGLFRPVTTD